VLAAIVEEEAVAVAPDSSQGGGVREGQRGLEEAEEPEVAGVDEPLLGERVDPGGEVFVDSVDQQVVGVEVGCLLNHHCFRLLSPLTPPLRNFQAVELEMEVVGVFQPDGEGGVGMEISEQNNGEKPQPAVASSVEGRGEDSGGPIGPRGEVQRRRKLVQSEIPTILKHQDELPVSARFKRGGVPGYQGQIAARDGLGLSAGKAWQTAPRSGTCPIALSCIRTPRMSSLIERRWG